MLNLPKVDTNVFLVGLCSSTGPGSGKSYIAEKMCEIINSKSNDTYSHRMSLAAKLKALAGRLVGISADSHEFKRSSYAFMSDLVTGRDILISLGEAVRTVFGPTFWIEQLSKSVDSFYDAYAGLDSGKIYSIIIIDDVRYENEASWIRANGGILFDIVDQDAKAIKSSDSGDLQFPKRNPITVIKNSKGSLPAVLESLCGGILALSKINREANSNG